MKIYTNLISRLFLVAESFFFDQGDMILDCDLYEELHPGKTCKTGQARTKRNALRTRKRLWTSRVIPYKIPSYMSKCWISILLFGNAVLRHFQIRELKFTKKLKCSCIIKQLRRYDECWKAPGNSDTSQNQSLRTRQEQWISTVCNLEEESESLIMNTNLLEQHSHS